MIDMEDIMSLWKRFTAWVSGWPENSVQGQKLHKDKELFAEEAAKNKPKVKPKKVKGLNPKKKKAKVKKQGNIS